ncbi:unnamed protein product [Clonostachys rhizophaga]|uniref:Aminoglycoside phosphotransferase domain-containing protein n=1 Tax=Clonostachys rhizophaga TaxID=160324 RepID=A0A9N9VAP2_9HYPO|nr:unnamed protein product [Clonostachys rhizophaga]
MDAERKENSKSFSGHQWTYFSSLSSGPIRTRAESFLVAVNWPRLLEYASKQRNGANASILPSIGLGGNHMVRVIEFDDGLPPLPDSGLSEGSLEAKSIRECNTILLLTKTSTVPIPAIHGFETGRDSGVNAPFSFMGCLEGNVGMDLGIDIPKAHNKEFFKELAEIHVDLSRIQLPKIGTVIAMNADGTFQQGPIPGIGGPFDTATEFFQAWATKKHFGASDDRLRALCGPYANEIVPSVASFTRSVADIAGKISITDDKGPFPLCHDDFGHNNIIVDYYRILGVIDWESAFAGPWEVFGEFPLSLSIVPLTMNLPKGYDETGWPKDPTLAQRFVDRGDYVNAVRQEEEGRQIVDHTLSDILQDTKRQHLITAMSLFENGKPGFYSKVVENFVSSI